ncbi:MAG: hypothetical protein HYZ62_01285 [Candidatus Andersenbacteria bacterium]|nr:hypothetical protein [Candidatus Andersenbacteria bacterium]
MARNEGVALASDACVHTTCISAMRGGVAEMVLRAIGQEVASDSSRRTCRPSRQAGQQICSVWPIGAPEPLLLRLILGQQAGLYLMDDPACRGWSLKPVKGERHVLRFGPDIPPHRIAGIAHAIIDAWVIKGFGWRNSKGELMPYPWGRDEDLDSERRRRRRRARLRRYTSRYARRHDGYSC